MHHEPRMLIVGGGLAGLSTGCYARLNGWDTTVIEHNTTLGGVCTAWRRGPYLIDGCIHWLTGGPFMWIYEELGIVPSVGLRTIHDFATYRDVRDGTEVVIGGGFDALRARLVAIGPEDAEEVDRIIAGARQALAMDPPIDRPPELVRWRERAAAVWEARGALPSLFHFRQPMAEYTAKHLRNPRLRRVISRLMPPEAPAHLLLFFVGYLCDGRLSRPVGTTERFRDSLIARYEALGGGVRTECTVREVNVVDGRARGVTLDDGTVIEADVVVSTSSAPETVRHLLGCRFGVGALEHRMKAWKTFEPIVLASFGVAAPLSEYPSTMILDGINPFTIGGRDNESIVVRIFNDEPAVAPPGHTVVQAMAATDYSWWAVRGDYRAAKAEVNDRIEHLLTAQIPELQGAVRTVDLATPLSFWRSARSWAGAYEGWLPTPENMTDHMEKSFPGLEGFYMAGQWVEPGGGVPMALMWGGRWCR